MSNNSTRDPIIADDGNKLDVWRGKDGRWRGYAVFAGQVMAESKPFCTEDEAWASCERMLALKAVSDAGMNPNSKGGAG